MQARYALNYVKSFLKQSSSAHGRKNTFRAGKSRSFSPAVLPSFQIRYFTNNQPYSTRTENKSQNSPENDNGDSKERFQQSRNAGAARALRGLIIHNRINDAVSFLKEKGFIDTPSMGSLLAQGMRDTEYAHLFVDFALSCYVEPSFYVHQEMFRPSFKILFRFKMLDLIEKALVTFAEKHTLRGRGKVFLFGSLWSKLIETHARSRNVDCCIRLLKIARSHGLILAKECISAVLKLATEHQHEELCEAACDSCTSYPEAMFISKKDFYVSIGSWSKALDCLNTLESRSKEELFVRTARQKVVALTGLKRYEEAELYYKQHVEPRRQTDTVFWVPYHVLFSIYASSGQLYKALTALDELLMQYQDVNSRKFLQVAVASGSPDFVDTVQGRFRPSSPESEWSRDVLMFQTLAALQSSISSSSDLASTWLQRLSVLLKEDEKAAPQSPSWHAGAKYELFSFLVSKLLDDSLSAVDAVERRKQILSFFGAAGFDPNSPKFWEDVWKTLLEKPKGQHQFSKWNEFISVVRNMAPESLPDSAVSTILARLSTGKPGSDVVLRNPEYLQCLSAADCATIALNMSPRRRPEIIRLLLPVMYNLLRSNDTSAIPAKSIRDFLDVMSQLHLATEMAAFWDVVVEVKYPISIHTLTVATVAFTACLLHTKAARLALEAFKLHRAGQLVLDKKYASMLVSRVIMPNISRAMRQDEGDGHKPSLTSPAVEFQLRRIPRQLANFVQIPASFDPLTSLEVDLLDAQIRVYLNLHRNR